MFIVILDSINKPTTMLQETIENLLKFENIELERLGAEKFNAPSIAFQKLKIMEIEKVMGKIEAYNTVLRAMDYDNQPA